MTPADIRRLRQRLGLTQEQLAAKILVARQSVVRWEQGTRPTRLARAALRALAATKDPPARDRRPLA